MSSEKSKQRANRSFSGSLIVSKIFNSSSSSSSSSSSNNSIAMTSVTSQTTSSLSSSSLPSQSSLGSLSASSPASSPSSSPASSPSSPDSHGRFRTVARPPVPLTVKLLPFHPFAKDAPVEWALSSKLLQAGPPSEILKYLLSSSAPSEFPALSQSLVGGYREYFRGADLIQGIAELYDGLSSDGVARAWQFLDLWFSFSHSIDFRFEKRLGTQILNLGSKLKSNDQANKWKLKLYRLQMGNPSNYAEAASPLEVSHLLQLSPLVLAQQLTCFESGLFERIHPYEFSQCAFNNPRVRLEHAPNLSRIAEHFNTLAFWVAGQVLSKETPKERAQLMSYFIKVAVLLKSFSNFNTMMSVLSGLSWTSVSRLKQSWALVPSHRISDFQELNDLMNPIRNYASYKKAFSEVADFKLPYIAATLRDCLLGGEGNPPLSAHAGINVQHLSVVGGIVYNLLRHQDNPSPFAEEPNVLALLASLSHQTEEELHALSTALEPPAHAIAEISLDDILASGPQCPPSPSSQSSSSQTSLSSPPAAMSSTPDHKGKQGGAVQEEADPFYKVDPAYWTPGQVVEWLSLMELTDYIEHVTSCQLNGQRFLSVDINTAVSARIGIRHRFVRAFDILMKNRHCGPWDLKSQASWSQDDVNGWLRFEGYEQFVAAFRDHNITGDLLSTLTDDDLKHIGVHLLGIRKRLLVHFRSPSELEVQIRSRKSITPAYQRSTLSAGRSPSLGSPL